MKRPWQVWTTFSVCLLITLSGMVWLTVTVRALDRADRVARRQRIERDHQDKFERDVQIALREMDLYLTEIIAREANWPYFSYRSFYIPEGKTLEGALPSPLLGDARKRNINLYFEIDPSNKNKVVSPQLPPDSMNDWALANGVLPGQFALTRDNVATLQALVNQNDLLASLPEEKFERVLPQPPALQQTEQQAANAPAIPPQNDTNNDDPFGDAQVASIDENAAESQSYVPPPREQSGQVAAPRQEAALTNDAPNAPAQQRAAPSPQQSKQQAYATRKYRLSKLGEAWNVQQRAAQEFNRSQLPQFQFDKITVTTIPNGKTKQLQYPGEVIEGVSRPLWLDSNLLLVRRVLVDDKIFLQGSWLDWDSIKQELADEVSGLIDVTDVLPVDDDTTTDPARMLAALPALVVVNSPAVPASSLAFGETSPVLLSLWVAWACVGLAVIASTVLLGGVISLSERRASFVSAVTHELRTPLTTFRMYSDMLAEDMVPEPEQRRQYLSTLRSEADRLCHLVENVLSYARLERGRAPVAIQEISVGTLIEGIERRQGDRASQADMQLIVEADATLSDRIMRTDASAVEQIVTNLVDNACKYARSAEDRRIHLSLHDERGKLAIRVSDHGPGVPTHDARRLFRPFTKSARDAAKSAPGVGLGLALSRRLATSLGGQLRLVPMADRGACFELKLAWPPA